MNVPNVGPIELIILIAVVTLIGVLLVWRAGSRSATDSETPDPLPDFQGATVVLRTHRSAGRESAVRWYQRDLDAMVRAGYRPASLAWQPGQWGFIEFLTALLLLPPGIGFIVALYLVIARPPGTMLATYALREA